MKLPHGKVPTDVLKEIVFKNLGAKREEVVFGPSVGVDGAVIDVGNYSLIASMDPITGAIERIGWLAVNINANDVATFGVEPAFLFSCILLPEDEDSKIVETICTQMDEAAKCLGIAIVGGHCEATPGLGNPMVVGCTIGITEKGKYVTAAGAKPRDKLILTKSAGIEGTAILASDRERQLTKKLNGKLVETAKGLYDQISVVKEAVTAFKTGDVHAMHDPTEGGVAGGIHEMADASNLGVRIFEEKIRIETATREICKFFSIDPLQLTGSGALLIAVKHDSVNKIVEELERKNIPASVIGEFLKDSNERIMVRKNRDVQVLPKPFSDHLWLALSKKAF